MGGILCGRNTVGRILCGRNPVWEESHVGGILCGRNPVGRNSVGGIHGEEYHDHRHTQKKRMMYTVFPAQGKVMKSNCEILITKPLTNWNKAGDSLNKHQSYQLHLLAIQKQKLNSDRFSKQKGGIDTLNAKEIKERAIKNTEILKGITRSVVFLGTQGLAFRGHNELLENDQNNPGNFLTSLQLLKRYE